MVLSLSLTLLHTTLTPTNTSFWEIHFDHPNKHQVKHIHYLDSTTTHSTWVGCVVVMFVANKKSPAIGVDTLDFRITIIHNRLALVYIVVPYSFEDTESLS